MREWFTAAAGRRLHAAPAAYLYQSMHYPAEFRAESLFALAFASPLHEQPQVHLLGIMLAAVAARSCVSDCTLQMQEHPYAPSSDRLSE